MALTKPRFLLPIVIETAAVLIKLDGSTDVTIAAGTYWWLEDGSASDFLFVLDTALTAAGDTWNVTINDTVDQDFILQFERTSGTTTSLVFQDLDILSPYHLGFSTDSTATTITITGGKDTGTYNLRWHWMPDEYTLGDQIQPRALTVVAQSDFDGSGIVDDYG